MKKSFYTNFDNDFIKKLFTKDGFGESFSPIPTGWIIDLYYDKYASLEKDFVVADYHTTPTDCGGRPMGAVSHAGTGYVDLLFTAVEMPDGKNVAYAGPVTSYHEYVTTNFLRLTDKEWKNTYLRQSQRPEWVNGYLANQQGESGSSILKLAESKQELEEIMSVDLDIEEITSLDNKAYQHQLSLSVSPNPVSSSTMIQYSIPETTGNELANLSIFNLQGKRINTLINEHLPPGNYITKWDDNQIKPGLYLLNLRVGQIEKSLKILVGHD